MQPEHKLYTYTYLYKISNTGTSFIRKMISLFVSSLGEYVTELDTLQAQKNLPELKKVLHKMKPSVMNLEVKGAGDILKSLSNAATWDSDTDQKINRLKEIFITIKPMMEADLANLGDDGT